MTVRNAESMGAFGSTWQHRGYAGQGNVESLIDSLRGRPALVCGNGEGVFDEYQAVLHAFPEAVIFAANDVGMYLPRLDHWVSLHADNLAAWKGVRWLHHHEKENTFYHADTQRPVVDYCWQQLTPTFCLSGYLAMQIAWLMGSDKIILCGCPGLQTRRFFDIAPRADFGYGNGPAGSDASVRIQIEQEMKRLPEFKAAVRSMSGWTKDFFGGL